MARRDLLALLLAVVALLALAGAALAGEDDDEGGAGGGGSGQGTTQGGSGGGGGGGGGSGGGGGGGGGQGSSQGGQGSGQSSWWCSQPRPAWWNSQWPPEGCPQPAQGSQPSAPQPGDQPAPPTSGSPTAPSADGTPPAAAEGTVEPVQGRSLGVAPAAGEVRVRPPGTQAWVPLSEGATVPVGTLVDARKGSVTLSAEAPAGGPVQAATFDGAVFSARQGDGPGAVTELVLRGGDFSACPRQRRRARAAIAAKRRGTNAVRRLWGSGKGRFRTRGRHSAATVRGTVWLTEDRCGSTVTSVRRGAVEVRDFGRERTVRVHAGERYVARPRGR